MASILVRVTETIQPIDSNETHALMGPRDVCNTIDTQFLRCQTIHVIDMFKIHMMVKINSNEMNAHRSTGVRFLEKECIVTLG